MPIHIYMYRYHVTYEDGDEEDLDKKQVEKYIRSYYNNFTNKTSSSPTATNATTGRGGTKGLSGGTGAREASLPTHQLIPTTTTAPTCSIPTAFDPTTSASTATANPIAATISNTTLTTANTNTTVYTTYTTAYTTEDDPQEREVTGTGRVYSTHRSGDEADGDDGDDGVF